MHIFVTASSRYKPNNSHTRPKQFEQSVTVAVGCYYIVYNIGLIGDSKDCVKNIEPIFITHDVVSQDTNTTAELLTIEYVLRGIDDEIHRRSKKYLYTNCESFISLINNKANYYSTGGSTLNRDLISLVDRIGVEIVNIGDHKKGCDKTIQDYIFRHLRKSSKANLKLRGL